mmetsp:Transcript_4533/g.9791  ORF Transcript_4533/g.9791 Transcript_4533/m.9791 type:complete len:267 (+) Transcript_4533:339-1139(+)
MDRGLDSIPTRAATGSPTTASMGTSHTSTRAKAGIASRILVTPRRRRCTHIRSSTTSTQSIRWISATIPRRGPHSATATTTSSSSNSVGNITSTIMMNSVSNSTVTNSNTNNSSTTSDSSRKRKHCATRHLAPRSSSAAQYSRVRLRSTHSPARRWMAPTATLARSLPRCLKMCLTTRCRTLTASITPLPTSRAPTTTTGSVEEASVASVAAPMSPPSGAKWTAWTRAGYHRRPRKRPTSYSSKACSEPKSESASDSDSENKLKWG